jgi:hypothetical protein
MQTGLYAESEANVRKNKNPADVQQLQRSGDLSTNTTLTAVGTDRHDSI